MKKLASLAGLAVAASSALGVAFSVGGPGGAIADGSGNNIPGAPLVMSGVIAAPGMVVTAVTKVSLIGASHTWIGDLTVVLTKDAAGSDLMDRNYRTTTTGFGSSADFTGGTYGLVAGGPLMPASGVVAPGDYGIFDNLVAGSSPTNGSYAAFVGIPVSGTWTVTVTDWAGGDIGAIEGFMVEGLMVPEPATLAALGIGLAALMRRRKK